MKRQSGKTTLVLNKIKENKNAVMIVFSQREKDRIEYENEWARWRVFTFEQWKDGRCFFGTNFKEAYMDQADMCLGSFTRVPITLITNDLEEEE